MNQIRSQVELKSLCKTGLAVSFVAATLFLLFFNSSMIGSDPTGALKHFATTFSIWFVLWVGNGWLSNNVAKNISWADAPIRKMIYIALSLYTYTTVAASVTLFICMKLLYGLEFDDILGVLSQQFYINLIIIAIIISLFMFGRGFFMAWRKDMKAKETLEKAHLFAQYETLKNQVNPHFLFNSLNVLTSLVKSDPDMAIEFINQLSSVYRYVLDNKEKEVVTIEEETKGLKAYIHLLKMRFGASMNVDMNLEALDALMIPPLTLQMLVENAIKHNIISKNKPLQIDIKVEDIETISVKNNLQKKPNSEPSGKVGLENIIARYKYISDRQIHIEENDQHFKVSIPLLKYS